MTAQEGYSDIPRSDSAEEMFLGAMLRNGTLVRMSRIEPVDFYSERHKIIFSAMKDLSKENTIVDVLTVSDRLKRMRTFELAGGDAYLIDLAESCASTTGWDGAEKIIEEKSTLRQCIAIADRLKKDVVSSDKSALDIVSDFNLGSSKLSSRGRSGVKMFQTLLSEYMSNPGSRLGDVTKTGLVFLDNALRIYPKQLGIIAARPGEGKTSLATQIAITVSRGKEVLINTLEMSFEELLQRITSQATQIPTYVLDDPNRFMSQSQIHDLGNLYGALDISMSECKTIDELRATALERKAAGRLGLIVVDYLQLMEVRRESGSRAQDVSSISRGLKLLAKELDVPIIALSQLSRESAKGTPSLHHLKESGAIEQDADWVVFIYSSDKDAWDESWDEGEMKILEVAKQRNGSVSGPMKVRWNGKTTSFLNQQ